MGSPGIGSCWPSVGLCSLSSVREVLGKLIQLHKRCKADKIKLKLCGIAKNPFDVFKITKLDKLFEIHKDADTTLAKF